MKIVSHDGMVTLTMTEQEAVDLRVDCSDVDATNSPVVNYLWYVLNSVRRENLVPLASPKTIYEAKVAELLEGK